MRVLIDPGTLKHFSEIFLYCILFSYKDAILSETRNSSVEVNYKWTLNHSV